MCLRNGNFILNAWRKKYESLVYNCYNFEVWIFYGFRFLVFLVKGFLVFEAIFFRFFKSQSKFFSKPLYKTISELQVDVQKVAALYLELEWSKNKVPSMTRKVVWILPFWKRKSFWISRKIVPVYR